MVVRGGDRHSGCKGASGDSGIWGGGEGRKRDSAVGDDGQSLKAGDII